MRHVRALQIKSPESKFGRKKGQGPPFGIIKVLILIAFAAAVRAVRRAAQRTDAGESALAALSSSGSLREIATAMRVRGARGVVASLSPGFLYLGENRPRYSEVPPMPE